MSNFDASPTAIIFSSAPIKPTQLPPPLVSVMIRKQPMTEIPNKVIHFNEKRSQKKTQHKLLSHPQHAS